MLVVKSLFSGSKFAVFHSYRPVLYNADTFF